jgi:hypothetical protein
MRLVLLFFFLAVALGAVCVAAASPKDDVAVLLKDKTGDVKPADLDLASVVVSRRAETLRVTFLLRGAPRGNAIYSVMLSTGDRLVQVAAKRAAGTDSFFVYRFSDNRNVYVKGSISGRTVTVRAPISVVGIRRTFRFSATAEPTNGRSGPTDHAPAGTKTVAFPG